MKFFSSSHLFVATYAFFVLVGKTIAQETAERDIGRFEIRAVGTAESTTDPIAALNAVAPRMKGTVYFEYSPETYTRIGVDPKLILYGMFQVSDEEISKPCSKAAGAVRILDSDFTQTFVKEENLEDDKKYMKLYKDSTQTYPKTPSGLIGHFIFDDLDLNTADETVTDGTTVKICARVVQATNDVTYSFVDTVFSIQRFYKGDIDLTINLEPVKEAMATVRIDTSLTFNEAKSKTDVENLAKAVIKAGLDAQRRKLIQEEPKENVELFANRILSEQSIAATCTIRECSPNVCYDCTVSVKMVMDALEAALAKFDPDNGTLDLKALFEQEMVNDTAFAGTTMVEFTNNGVTVIPDGMGLVEDTDANIINAETYLCNIINNAKLDSNSVSTPLSIGQDFKVCVKPEEQTDSLFKYQTAGFRSVSCSYTTAASGTSSETLVDANGIAPSAHTLIDTAPDTDGVMGFVSMILPQYMQDTNKAIDCQGTAVIQNVRASSTRRLVEQERRSELTEGTTQSVFYEHYEEEVVGKEVPFSSTSSLGRDENKNRRELQETVQGVSFAPRIQSATDFSLGISLDSGVASTGSLHRVGSLATTLFIMVVVNAFL